MNRTLIVCAAVVAFLVTALYSQKPNAPAPVQAVPTVMRVSDASAAANVVEAASVIDAPSDAADDEARVEREQLTEYVGGISNFAPVSAEQQRAILEAKLRHKADYETVLRDSGFREERLSTAEREYAHRMVARALSDYRESYLLDVQPILSAEQFTQLSNYESTEFQRELARLQSAINAK
jgi:hypothetical protein